MSKPAIPVVVVFTILPFLFSAGGAFATQTEFSVWLNTLRAEALEQGISTSTLDSALADIEPVERVIELDRRQPEFTQTFWNYIDARVTNWRIKKGRVMLKKHRRLLKQVEAQYGVPPRYLVAFWGLETNFGNNLGTFPTVASLATLAYDPRRSAFFRMQLLDALRIVDRGHVAPASMLGSWAGAMGHLQFMPATFIAYASDADNDGKKDIWDNLTDVFASGANYLSSVGWRHGELWGREVRLPSDFDWELAQLQNKKSVARWAALGVTRADRTPLPQRNDILGAIVLPQGHKGPAFLVYENFETMLHWNRSINYAITVGHLADRIIGLPTLRTGREADNRNLSREQALELQQELNAMGFNVGKPDGIIGARTRHAVRNYQKKVGLPADGHPSISILRTISEARL